MNCFNKTKPWIAAASLLAASSAFAANNQPDPCCFEKGHEMPKNQMAPLLSAPARFEVNCGWDVFTTGSYIYWQAREENLDLGMISNAVDPFGTTNVYLPLESKSKEVHPHFTFRSGFKLGLGLNLDYDNLDMYSEYTWFHGHIETGIRPFPTFFTNNGTSFNPIGHVIYPQQGHPSGFIVHPENNYFVSANSSWGLKMDFVDLSIGRSYYSGTNLTIRPFFGARGAWIRQKMENVYNGSTLEAPRLNPENAHVIDTILNKTVSQGIGPRAGLESNWLLGYGFRFLGNGSADVLYTRYNFLFKQFRFDMTGNGSVLSSAKFKEEHEDYLRAHVDIEMGFGWGTYLDDQKWHIDLAASYGFQVFWDQNMFRNFLDNVMQGKSIAPNGNLFIHGLTATARLDF